MEILNERKRKRGIIAITAAIVVMIFAVLVGHGIYNGPEKRLARALDLGQKYLQEENYEQAIVEFETAMEIEPKCEDAYLGMAEAYIGIQNYEEAVKILQTGYEITGEKRLQKGLEQIQKAYMENQDIDIEDNDFEALEDDFDKQSEVVETNFREKGVEIFLINADGNKIPQEAYENIYDEMGYRTCCIGRKTSEEDDVGEFWFDEWHDEYLYDGDGNHIRTNCYGNDSLYYHYENDYDQTGKCVKESFFNDMTGESLLESCTENTYNELGLLVRQDVQYYFENVKTVKYRYEYKYNEKNELVEKDLYAGNFGEGIDDEVMDYLWRYEYKYSYDGEGRCIKYYYTEDDSMDTEFEYDAGGVLVSKKENYGDGMYRQINYIWEKGSCMESGTYSNEYGEYINRYSGAG